jgi:hypothetical protein
MFIKVKIYIRIYWLAEVRTVNYYMTVSSSRHKARPHDKQNANVLTTTKIWSRVPEGLNAKTDWLSSSCKVTYYDNVGNSEEQLQNKNWREDAEQHTARDKLNNFKL